MRRARQVDRTPRVSAKINDQIGAHEVRLVGAEGEQLGVKSADDAREYAYARDLDLVEVAAAADPPVCRVMDYGKWRYEEERKAAREPAQPGARVVQGGAAPAEDRRSTTTSGSATARSSSSGSARR